MDPYLLFFFFGGCVACVAAYAKTHIHVVREGEQMVVEKGGCFSRVLGAGIHLLGALEFPRSVHWSYHEEVVTGGRIEKRSFDSTTIPVSNCQLNCVPYESLTKDMVKTTVNGTLHYKITDAQKSVYSIQNLLGFLSDCVESASRRLCVENTHEELHGNDLLIANTILEYINEETVPYGVRCSKFIVQSIDMDESIVNSIERQIVKDRENQVRLAQKQQEQELLLMTERHAHQMEEERNKNEHHAIMESSKRKREQEIADVSHRTRMSTEKQNAAYDLDMKKLRADVEVHKAQEELKSAQVAAECERKNMLTEADISCELKRSRARLDEERAKDQMRATAYKQMLESGISADQLTQIEVAPLLATAMGKMDKWVISDSTAAHMPLLSMLTPRAKV